MILKGSRLAFLLGALILPLMACGNFKTFQTYYVAPVPAQMARSWHVVGVDVTVPEKLTVSEEHSFEPKADIMWREDPIGDRRAQVAVIMKAAIAKGAAPLHGPRAVRLQVTMKRFHALTLEAESVNISGVGVHNVEFDIAVVDARTGAVLVPAISMDASLPALTGVEMINARLKGQSQKSQITAHVAATIAGWLGVGPDQRGSFVRVGE